jgi:hypothetical protein
VQSCLKQFTQQWWPSCVQVEMKALDELIAQKLPRLSAHLNALEADVSILATDWFLTLFSASMPSETVSGISQHFSCG